MDINNTQYENNSNEMKKLKKKSNIAKKLNDILTKKKETQLEITNFERYEIEMFGS